MNEKVFFKEPKSNLNSNEIKKNDNTNAKKIPKNQDHNNPINPDNNNTKVTLTTLNNTSFTKTINCFSCDINIVPNKEYTVLNKQNTMNEIIYTQLELKKASSELTKIKNPMDNNNDTMEVTNNALNPNTLSLYFNIETLNPNNDNEEINAIADITAVANPTCSDGNILAAMDQNINPNNAIEAELIIKYIEFLYNDSLNIFFIIFPIKNPN